jgi:CRP-like cAMP-binding protein
MASGETTRSSSAGPLEELLCNFPLLAELDRGAIRLLARAAVRYDLPHGRVLFRQGAPCAGIHLVAGGQIKLSIQTAHGSEKVIELVGAGRSLGELALLTSQRYLMSAEAVADSTIVQLGAGPVFEELAQNGQFLRSILREVCTRLTRRTRDLEDHLLLNGTQRVTGFLLDLLSVDAFSCEPATITLPAKKSLIASRLNLTQEHFSRILHDLQSAGLIAVHGRQVCLLDLRRLRTLPDRVNGGARQDAC